MLEGFSRLHSFLKSSIGKKNNLFLISATTIFLVIIASSTVYYLANYSVNSSTGEVKSQVSRPTPTPGVESKESSPSSNVKGAQATKEVEVPQSTSAPTYTTPPAVNPTTAPVQNYQTPNYQAPIIIYQPPTTSDVNSYTSPATDAQIERLHQQQEENAKRQEYCNQIRDQRSAAVAPYAAKRDGILNQYNGAITNYSPGQLDSLWKQSLEANAEYWKVYNSFDTSCI